MTLPLPWDDVRRLVLARCRRQLALLRELGLEEDDLWQELAVRLLALSGRSAYDARRARPSTWVVLAARHRLGRMIEERLRDRRERLGWSTPDGEVDVAQAEIAGVVLPAGAHEHALGVVLSHLDGLPSRQVELVAGWAEGRTGSELAASAGLSRSRVTQVVRRARQRLVEGGWGS